MSARHTVDALLGYLRHFRSGQPSRSKPVFWLGAGCSVHDGVPLSSQLLQLAVASNPAAWGSPQFQFDEFCDHLGRGADRARYLAPHVVRALKPDSPYHGMVKVLRAGFVDLVFTFNIDGLLEKALEEAGLTNGTDYVVVKVPKLRVDVATQEIDDDNGPRIRVVELHGDHKSGFNLMTSAEIREYDPKIAALVREYSKRAAVVCGYSFFHLNVLTAFSTDGKPLFYVNRSFPDAPPILSLMTSRSKSPYFVDQPLGLYTTFMETLVKELPA